MAPTRSNISAKHESCRIRDDSIVNMSDQDRNLFETLFRPGAKGLLGHVCCRHSGAPRDPYGFSTLSGYFTTTYAISFAFRYRYETISVNVRIFISRSRFVL